MAYDGEFYVEVSTRVPVLMVIQVGIPCNLTNDSKRFLLEHFDAIHNSPSQIYHFALPLCPSSSWLHKCYSVELSLGVKVVKELSAKWGACSCTVPQDNNIEALSCWKNTVAVGCGRGIIIIDAITGSKTATLSGHTGSVTSVVFSSDGRLIVSGSNDTTVKLWDVQTGGVIKTFYGHTGWVQSVSISADQTRIASGCDDNTICLWDVITRECLYTIEQEAPVCHVSFSPIDPQFIISISNKVWQLNINSHQLSPIYDGIHIAFSPHHDYFALCNWEVVTVHNSDSKAIVAEFYVANSWTNHCCFSPDGRLIAAAAHEIAYIWDITGPNPHLVETFVGITPYITSLAFSSPSILISVSPDGSIKFWQIGVLSTDPVTTDQQSILPPIQSVSLQAKAGVAISHDNDGMVKTWDISTGICNAIFQIPNAKNMQQGRSDAKLIDGRFIFVWYKNRKTHIWDTKTEELLQTLDTSECWGLRISGDGSKLFFLSEESIQVWSMWTWEPVGEVKLGLGWVPHLDSFCIESSEIRIYNLNSLILGGWDFGISGSSPVPFDPSIQKPHLDFIGVVWLIDGPARIKDTTTGKEIFWLSGRYARPRDTQWDGRYLIAGYGSGEVLILDFYGVCPQ